MRAAADENGTYEQLTCFGNCTRIQVFDPAVFGYRRFPIVCCTGVAGLSGPARLHRKAFANDGDHHQHLSLRLITCCLEWLSPPPTQVGLTSIPPLRVAALSHWRACHFGRRVASRLTFLSTQLLHSFSQPHLIIFAKRSRSPVQSWTVL